MIIDDLTEDGLSKLSDDELFELLKTRRLERRKRPETKTKKPVGEKKRETKQDKLTKQVEDLF